ncbi:MAG: HNH endonuclease, partial [[Clostridium] innocuum]
YEAIDHDNGLLLCRNHDYLFDQGYFTFDENGYIIFSEELLDKENLDSAYSLRKNYRLQDCYLSENRMKFMAYHREFIFRRNR